MSSAEYHHEYYLKNRERKRLYDRARYQRIDKVALRKQKNEWRRNNPDKNREYQKRYYLKRPEQRILDTARRRSKKRGWECNIDLSDIAIPEFCPVFPWLKLETNKGYKGPNSPSIDRIDNTKGYVKGNVRIISDRANTLKSDAVFRELQRLAEDARQWPSSEAQ